MTRSIPAALHYLLCLTLILPALAGRPLFAQQPCSVQQLSPQSRIGINVAREEGKELTDYAVERIGAGWYLDYAWHVQPARPGGMTYFPMVRPQQIDPTTLATTVGPAVDANPGATWILGNEPDNGDQDKRTPAEYATFYHTLYQFLKARDPSSRVAIGAVTAVTPLRLRYLDAVLESYRTQFGAELPVDLWTIHIYLLPEISPGGIGIPVGLEAYRDEALLVELAEHDNLESFAAQVSEFRAWMARRGFRNHELILSEYGILLPPTFGFDEARVRNFMLGSFAFLQTARDELTGLPTDDNRLVQRWGWFSLNYYAYNPTGTRGERAGLNGNLFDHGSGAITGLGIAFGDYLTRLTTQTVDLALQTVPAGAGATTVTIVNRGDALAPGFRLRLWSGQRMLGTITSTQPVQPHCANQVHLPITWQQRPTAALDPLNIQVLPLSGQFEYDPTDNHTD